MLGQESYIPTILVMGEPCNVNLLRFHRVAFEIETDKNLEGRAVNPDYAVNFVEVDFLECR